MHEIEHFCLQIVIYGLYSQFVLKSFMGCQCDMSDQNHLEKFSSTVVVKIHFWGNDLEGVDQSIEIKFCIFIYKIITISVHCFRLYTLHF
jgi:hypothetical protein